MLPEHRLSIVFTGMGAGLVIPQLVYLSHHPHPAPDGTLVTDIVLGALGVFFGSILVERPPERAALALGVGLWIWIWILIGLAYTGVGAFALTQSATRGRRLLFAVSAILPLLGPFVVLARRARK